MGTELLVIKSGLAASTFLQTERQAAQALAAATRLMATD